MTIAIESPSIAPSHRSAPPEETRMHRRPGGAADVTPDSARPPTACGVRRRRVRGVGSRSARHQGRGHAGSRPGHRHDRVAPPAFAAIRQSEDDHGRTHDTPRPHRMVRLDVRRRRQGARLLHRRARMGHRGHGCRERSVHGVQGRRSPGGRTDGQALRRAGSVRADGLDVLRDGGRRRCARGPGSPMRAVSFSPDRWTSPRWGAWRSSRTPPAESSAS